MKKAILIVFVLFTMYIALCAYAVDYKSNIYYKSVAVSSTDTTETITFPFNSRGLTIINGDSTDSVWVSASNASVTATDVVTYENTNAFRLQADGSVTLDNFVTDRVIINYVDGPASPVTVISIY